MVDTPGPYNAHVLDLRAHAASPPHPEGRGDLSDRLACCTLKLEGVEPAVIERLGRMISELGGELTVLGPPAGVPELPGADRKPGCSDLLLSGTRRVLARLADRLRGGPSGPALLSGEIERCLSPGNRVLAWGSRTLDFRRQTCVMGILNCTPDSFYPGSRSPDPGAALERARGMIAEGADILDVGGESTRPGSEEISLDEELVRILPVIRALRAESDVILSVDTRRHQVAAAALEAGADLVNDVSGMRFDPEMAPLVAARRVPVVLMHMRGVPRTMQELARYDDTVGEVLRELRLTVDEALRSGVAPDRIIVDPGIGFSKNAEDNLRLLRNLPSFTSLGSPLLIGLSRKSFIGHLTGRPVEERLAGSVAANALAVFLGADIVRVHDVREAVDAVRLARAVLDAGGGVEGGADER